MREFAHQNLVHKSTFKKVDVVSWFSRNYPDVKESTIKAHVEAMAINAVGWRKNDPALKPGQGWDLFFKVAPGVFRLWEPEGDSPPVYHDKFTSQDHPSLNQEIPSIRSTRPRIDLSEVRQFGEGVENVYVYGYRAAPGVVKIGRSHGEVEKRIIDQTRTAAPGMPILYLKIRTANCRSLESCLHNELAIRKKKLFGGGNEWFETTPDEVIEIYNSISITNDD